MNEVLTMVLAGGTGTRLMPLTASRAKPAVPFGGRYRIIDFALSNCVNSGLYRIKVLTQYKSESLQWHLLRGWRLSSVVGHYVDPVPAQQRTGNHWYLGSADAVFQNLNLVRDEAPNHLLVLSGDHVYRMDYRQMIAVHLDCGADATVAALPVPVAEAAGTFGVISVDEDGWITAFTEKPAVPAEIPGRPGWTLASMGNYLFRTEAVVDAVNADAADPDSSHDFGRDVITQMAGRGRLKAYDFSQNVVPGVEESGRAYWRDVGTVGAYFEASMDLVSIDPLLNLYNQLWPLWSQAAPLPPAKFVFSGSDREGAATDSLVSQGCIVSGGHLHRCILGPRVRVNSWSDVEESILFDDVVIGRHARVRRAIVDKKVVVPEGAEIGFDPKADAERFHVTEDGIVVVQKGQEIT